MTKFMNFNPDNTKTGKKSTEFKYQVGGSSAPEIQESEYSPEEFNNVIYLCYDAYLELDVFMAWNNNITFSWIFYGTKGDEFE
jgi:hypothetical protein